ncbi:claudin-11-like [Anarrhichthys ocellatus]|uniref:claudin-11-like n=1 Tax=Anarrhichthys ocellatus TaxID=433405 RepID=UPI0012EECD0F|nr:claudin-11-like [Anarrhichthys ocellatus]
MAHMCRQMTGIAASCAGWVGIIVATATNDWVRSCDYAVVTCIRMDELGSQGLWVKCVISPALYHCVARTQILSLPAYVQTCRALMICACLLGLPAMLLVLMSMPCVKLQTDNFAIKQRRALVGGILYILMALCGIISTVWFPVGVHQEEGLMSFGFSLYAGWVGSALCLLGGTLILFCRGTDPGTPSRDSSFYYSRQEGTATPLDPPANHAKSERV